MAEEDLLERLRAVARREGVSLATVIRQGLEWRVGEAATRPNFIGAGASSPPHDTARRAGDAPFEPRSWR
jgi:hypothetical protein